MARYKPYSYEQTKLIHVSYDRQILPGTFEATGASEKRAG
jgi:hypothetical protein